MFLLHTLQVLGSVEDERTFSNVAFLKKQTPQSIDRALASCYHYVCTKTLHFDFILLQGSCFGLEGFKAEAG
jgi:hypothetical protein